MQILIKRFYNIHSGMNKGTLYQLRCLINRRNISTHVSQEMNQLQDFLHSVMKAHILSAAMDFFNMEDKSSQPSSHKWSDPLATSPSNEQKWQYLSNTLGVYVDRYIMPCLVFDMPCQPQDKGEAISHTTKKKGVRKHQQPQPKDKEQETEKGKEGFSIRNYAMALLTDTLMAEEMIDAVREGDGDRVVCFWQFMLLYCTATGHTKYAFEGFNLLAQLSAILTPQEAFRTKWCRFANTRGGADHNISGDLLMEHWNKALKTHLCSICANISSQTIVNTAKALSSLQCICSAFDETTAGIHRTSQRHSVRSDERDEATLLDLLHSEKVFSSSHSHSHFPKFMPNLFDKIDKVKLSGRIKSNIKKYTTAQLSKQTCFLVDNDIDDSGCPTVSEPLDTDMSMAEFNIECMENPLFM